MQLTQYVQSSQDVLVLIILENLTIYYYFVLQGPYWCTLPLIVNHYHFQGPYRHYILNALWILINLLCLMLTLYQVLFLILTLYQVVLYA